MALETSAICLGTATYGSQTPPDACRALLDRYAESGGAFIDTKIARTCDARAPHAAGDNGRMARHTASTGQDSLGRMHAVNVFGARLAAHENDVLTFRRHVFGLICTENHLARRRTGRSR